MEWEPGPSAVVVTVAVPAASVPVARTVAPSLNVTDPEQVPLPTVGVTVAVKVTGCPKAEVSGLAVSVVVVRHLVDVLGEGTAARQEGRRATVGCGHDVAPHGECGGRQARLPTAAERDCCAGPAVNEELDRTGRGGPAPRSRDCGREGDRLPEDRRVWVGGEGRNAGRRTCEFERTDVADPRNRPDDPALIGRRAGGVVAGVDRNTAGQQRVCPGRAVLSASGPSSGSIGLAPEPTRLLLTPLASPTEPVPSPIRLLLLEATTVPLMSSRTAGLELKLRATIVLSSVTPLAFCRNPPPAPAPSLSSSAVLFVTVTLFSVTLPVLPKGVTKIRAAAVVVSAVPGDRAIRDIDRAVIASGGDLLRRCPAHRRPHWRCCRRSCCW